MSQAITDAMVEASAKVLNERLAKEDGLFGVSRDMLSAALSSVPPAVPGEVHAQLALIKHLAEYTTEKNWDDKRLYIMQAVDRALSVPLPEIEGGNKGDNRPSSCRFRLQDEGKAYPRSSCEACKRTIITGLGSRCHIENPAAPSASIDGETP